MERGEEVRLTSALADSFGGLAYISDAQRSIGMNPRTGEADDINPGLDYYPLTAEQAREVEGMTSEERRDLQYLAGETREGYIRVGGEVIHAMRRTVELQQ